MTEKDEFEQIIRRFYGADDNAYEAAADLTDLLWPAIEHLAKNRFVGLSSAALDERDSIMANEAAEQTLVRAEAAIDAVIERYTAYVTDSVMRQHQIEYAPKEDYVNAIRDLRRAAALSTKLEGQG